MPHVSVTFWQVEKRTNSTRRPHGKGAVYDCQIFDECSIISPRIKLAFPDGAGNPTLYNTAYIGDFTRYYFVRDWTWSGGLWIAQLEEDVLATWATNILDATEYVTRASNEFDGSIVDTLYPTVAGTTAQRVAGTNQFTDNYQLGSFILSTVTDFGSGANTGFGSNVFYAMNSAAFGALRAALLQNTDYLNINAEEISENLTKALLNPYQYLTSCMFFPFEWPKNTAYDFSDIGVGWWSLNLGNRTANVLTPNYDTAAFIQQFTLPKHPQSGARGKWLNLEPYTTYTLFVPPFGEIHLDGNMLVDAESVYYKIIVDGYTGQGLLTVTIGQPGSDMSSIGSSVLAHRTAQVGVPVSLAQIAYNPIDSLGELVGLAGTAIHGLAQGLAESAGTEAGFFDTFDNVANSIGDAISHKTSEAQYKGSCGAVSLYTQSPYLEAKFTLISDEDNEHRGRPLCKKRQLRTLPGYVKCMDSDIAVAGTKQENDAIKRYLSSTGVYIE